MQPPGDHHDDDDCEDYDCEGDDCDDDCDEDLDGNNHQGGVWSAPGWGGASPLCEVLPGWKSPCSWVQRQRHLHIPGGRLMFGPNRFFLLSKTMFNNVEHQFHQSSDHFCTFLSYSAVTIVIVIFDNITTMMVQVKENYRKYSRLGRCLGHSSHVIQLDWTTDCQHLRSNSADHEVFLVAILVVTVGAYQDNFCYNV